MQAHAKSLEPRIVLPQHRYPLDLIVQESSKRLSHPPKAYTELFCFHAVILYDMRTAILATLLTSALLSAQQPVENEQGADKTPSLDEMVANIQRIRPGSTKLDRFKAFLQITPTGKKDDRITILLRIKFLLPGMIRYLTSETGQEIQRGWDQNGPWARIGKDDDIADLRERHYRQDRDQLRRELALARLLLRFMDPATVLTELENPTPVSEDQLKIGRTKAIRAYMVTGQLATYPFYSDTGNTHPAKVGVWIDVTSKRLIAVSAYPIDKSGKQAAAGEFLLLSKHKTRAGIQIPSQLDVYSLGPQGRTPLVRMELASLELTTPLTVKDFNRATPWR